MLRESSKSQDWQVSDIFVAVSLDEVSGYGRPSHQGTAIPIRLQYLQPLVNHSGGYLARGLHARLCSIQSVMILDLGQQFVINALSM